MKPNEIEKMLSDAEMRVAAEKRRLLLWSNGRLISALAVLVGLVFGIRNDLLPGYALAVAGVICFCYLVHRFNQQQAVIELAQNRLLVLQRYDARCKGEWYDFADDGASYVRKDDFLSSDLDLFGPRSLYQYISVAHTIGGRDALMRLLTRPNLKHIAERQASVLELLRDDALAIDFEALGLAKDRRREEDERKAEAKLRHYATGKGNSSVPQVKLLALGMPAITLLLVVTALLGVTSWMMVLYCFFLQLIASVLLSGSIQTEKESVMVLARRLSRAEERINVILSPDFQSAYLREMQQQLANAGEGIRSLNRIVNAWQLRENFVLYLPLVGLLAWDFNCCMALDSWRKKYGTSFGLWMDWLGEVEALYSLGTLSRMRSDETTVPDIVPGAPLLDMVDGKHPLLDPRTVVGNDYSQGGDTVIITGSNMSGKSTFMRTIALNAVLAYAGGTVMAKQFRISPMRIFTSMRVSDDVSEGISSFYGEILRIKQMVNWSQQQQPMLVLVDEIFKGTNSADRIIGAQAAIRKLSHPWMMTLVTTHDFELCALADSPEVNGKNYHFEEHYEGDAIAFDYKIRPGRCRTTNAKHLMRIAGLLDDEDPVKEKEDAHVL
ncbi:MAG: mannonate oxidoreductase [Peptococcaceae bacterium]|nr:mannonate oxidoreductase [Peptococcaceae bacterium]